MKKLSRKSLLLIISGVVLVSVAITTLFVTKSPLNMANVDTANPKVTDDQIIQDLTVLEEAAFGQGKTLPQGLNQVSISGLKGNENDYWYRVVVQPSADYNPTGGAGGVFDLCATFHTRAKLDESSFDYGITYNSPEGYGYHQRGMQCYRVSDSQHYNGVTIEVLKHTPSWVGK